MASCLPTGIRRWLGAVCFRKPRAILKSKDRLTQTAILGLLSAIALGGCRTRGSDASPSIGFTRVPPEAAGGPDTLDIIEGRVSGARPGLRIVLYSRSGKWWVQPLVDEPFTQIRPDSSWTNSTHLGTEYAALLVDAGFQPTATLNELPTRGGDVLAVATVPGSTPGSTVTKTLQFGGYEWRIRTAPSDRGGVNKYDPKNAWTDSKGALHLQISGASGEWTCAEVALTRSLGYGTYSFLVNDTSHLEPAVVFSIFTWDYAGTDPNHREMDIEVSRWGDQSTRNAQYVVQPFYIPENTARFMEPAGVLRHTFHWEPGSVSFRTVQEPQGGAKPVVASEHVFTSGIPSPGAESVRMTLYLFRDAREPLQHGTEVVVDKFEFLP